MHLNPFLCPSAQTWPHNTWVWTCETKAQFETNQFFLSSPKLLKLTPFKQYPNTEKIAPCDPISQIILFLIPLSQIVLLHHCLCPLHCVQKAAPLTHLPGIMLSRAIALALRLPALPECTQPDWIALLLLLSACYIHIQASNQRSSSMYANTTCTWFTSQGLCHSKNSKLLHSWNVHIHRSSHPRTMHTQTITY